MADSYIYLDTYVLQQDMRVRLPKAILSNMKVEKGKTKFDIYLDSSDDSLLLRIHNEEDGGSNNE
ncbi:AbrB/MazE/SpoVT family DNA-binding domain-containing protein [Caproicibacterium sp. BJN0003]|uniref:AbrB/MazE/SpoVT family DNA-binding domain-containing protein n=1 Tax=Caproicibacterium sp. BJN0003 TaxID=2994078 RepID=UPI0022506742|nr:AbrB/MazE/SpoVT family DNA-binding domain-containing protein [Caproicibacterium sp. BJN0003]UZT81515.1 AbrB/MazE/SpoVT family DNA-binding domain-containing protein [Caproicibacterium sp. BJN0003]